MQVAKQKQSLVRWLLMPFSWLYEVILLLRNVMYDAGVLKSHDVSHLPVICVGNLTVGGTGKTPHTEYLIRLLQQCGWHVSVVSRGYRRKTSGLIHATQTMKSDDIGDEPWQMLHKYPEIEMVVSRDRYEGIMSLLSTDGDSKTEVVVLDDAYQHRKVRTGMNILLTDCNRLMCDDVLLPAGRLREPFSGRKRAQVVIVTKCGDITPEERNTICQRLCLSDNQRLYFTRQKYQEIKRIFAENGSKTLDLSEVSSVLLLTGIATPQLLVHDLKERGLEVNVLQYADHHRYTIADEQHINEVFESMASKNPIVLTTEKDAARLVQCKNLSDKVRASLYVLPLEIEFLMDGEEFNKYICDYVRQNQRNV